MRDFKALVRQHLSLSAFPHDHETKIVEELAAQIEDAYDALVARGLSDDNAWDELQRQIPDWRAIGKELLDSEPAIVRLAAPSEGPLNGSAKHAVVSAIRDLFGQGIGRDLRSGIRRLVKDRGFTFATVLTLAVCLGANAAIFTIVYSLLLRPLPIPDSDRIVALGDVYPTITPTDILSNTAPSYIDRLKAIDALEDQALFAQWFDTLPIDGMAEEVRGMRATPSLFRLLRVEPALGRTFTDAEGTIGHERKILLSHGLWQRLYGGDSAVLGRDLRLGWTGQLYTIVGVMPQGFSFFDRGSDGHARTVGEGVEFWIPLAFTPAQLDEEARTRYGFFHVGRIRHGATIEQVRAQADALNQATFQRFPQFGLAELGMYTAVTPLQDALTRRVSGILYLLWGGAACVLLIGVLNVANLSLARASARGRDVAVRLALGASRLRVTRELVVEGVLLTSTAGVAGVIIAAWIVQTLVASELATLPNAAAVRLDGTVATLTLALSALLGSLIGLVPAAASIRGTLNQALLEGNRSGTGGRAARLFRRGLVVVQVACSVVLLIGASLLLTSFRNLLAVDPGFRAERVTTATIFPPPSRYGDQAAVTALMTRILESVRRIPGVEAAGITSNVALSGRTSPATVFAADYTLRPGEAVVLPSVVSVTPGYLEAMATTVTRGRSFTDSDREQAHRVAIVDERMAARFWPGADPIGKALRRGNSALFTVVGVVRAVRFESLAGQAESTGTVYFPHAQAPFASRLRWLAVRTSAGSSGVMPAIRAALKAIDPDLPLSDIQTMSQRTLRSVAPQRLAMALAGVYGVVAMMLSAVGIYGVLAYVVARRTREIGIRLALGSTARGIFRLVFKEGLLLVAAGVALGLVGALALGRTLEGQVFGVKPSDPIVLGVVAVSAAAIALAACVLPARRATRVDPVNVLSEP